ncbi:MAG TPA: hypothetical protein VGQ76_28225 [Thermoanaerobaculia bacterium]|jgi:hypothetical protein|nr:hypothetical protein [Thermoanaerobaculia bacterium]
MKPLTLLLLFAIPLFASEDSPLVAAAKRNGRAKVPKKVITNETVKTSKGRVTTTKFQPPIVLSALPVVPSAKPVVAGKAQKIRPLTQAAEDKRAADKRERRKARAAAAAEEGMLDTIDDAQEAEQKPPR